MRCSRKLTTENVPTYGQRDWQGPVFGRPVNDLPTRIRRDRTLVPVDHTRLLRDVPNFSRRMPSSPRHPWPKLRLQSVYLTPQPSADYRHVWKIFRTITARSVWLVYSTNTEGRSCGVRNRGTYSSRLNNETSLGAPECAVLNGPIRTTATPTIGVWILSAEHVKNHPKTRLRIIFEASWAYQEISDLVLRDELGILDALREYRVIKGVASPHAPYENVRGRMPRSFSQATINQSEFRALQHNAMTSADSLQTPSRQLPSGQILGHGNELQRCRDQRIALSLAGSTFGRTLRHRSHVSHAEEPIPKVRTARNRTPFRTAAYKSSASGRRGADGKKCSELEWKTGAYSRSF
ncbi:hypothetical protein NM688_g3166 [Phlebia brevispora]|uniref:Uncharacterized protein n=1 Tax=Phlebia brevispora TaxID=194682 RepID=A0ACC1T6N2_9APHY|nr:hypothetical protein NM688_g3166 [Phlebia brevispora]